MRDLSPVEVGYIAGIIDGEGNIGVRRRLRKYITPMLQVTNTKRELLDWLSARLGGTVYENSEPREGRNRLWSWQLWGANAQEVIRAVRPFLVIKAKQADLALLVKRFPTNGRKSVMTAFDFEYNDAIYEQFRALNWRGTRPPPNAVSA